MAKIAITFLKQYTSSLVQHLAYSVIFSHLIKWNDMLRIGHVDERIANITFVLKSRR